jgi:uncharacterized repeat protein (TIGR01451 family)
MTVSADARRGWRRSLRAALLGVLSVALIAIGSALPIQAASAAGTATVGISASPTTVLAGASSTLTLSLTCGVTGGCANTTLTFPIPSYTNLRGTTVTDATAFTQMSCPGWTQTSSATTVTYTYTGGTPAGTFATGALQCTIVYKTTNYTTPNGQALTITPTINGSNFASASGAPVTITVTASHLMNFTKSAPVQVGQGGQFVYDLHFNCTSNQLVGAIGTSSFTLSDPFPAGFTYQSYQTIFNANNGNYGGGTFPGTITWDPATRTLNYDNPTGSICDGSVSGAPGRDFWVTGTASEGGTPDAIGTTLTNTATASWTYLDGTTGGNASTFNTQVVAVVPTSFVSKSAGGQTFPNRGQYRYPPNNGAYPYVYPGDYSGSGQTAQYAINLFTNSTQAGAAFEVKDPLPCTTNNATPGTSANPNYASNAPGTLCASPAFIPTVISAGGFTPTAADSVTVVHTDGSTATIAYTPGTGWVIPTSPAVSELDFPAFASEGQNTLTMMQFVVKGYTAAGLPDKSLMTNTATATPYTVGSTTPLAAARTGSAILMVVSAAAPSGTVIVPGIYPRYNGGSTCTEVVGIGAFGGNGPQSNYIEIAQAPSQAIYLSYLAPAGANVTAGTTQTFTFTPANFAPWASSPGTGGGTASGIVGTVTNDYNGTGRQLVQWVVPAGTITTPGDYIFTGNNLTVNLGAGCAGTYQNDVTVGYGAPITACYPVTTVPTVGTNNALATTNAPVPTNYCGESLNITVAPINPGYSVDKTVQGNLDPSPVGAGGTGNVSPQGGAATYNLSFTNTGQANLHDPVLYDLLPRVGDTEASSNTPRNSAFPVTLASVGTPPANVTVAYSTATNPCRPELVPNASNPGCVDDWSTTPPSPLSSTTALRITYNGLLTVGTSNTGVHGFSLPYTVSTPAAAVGQIAWNSVGSNVYAGDTYLGAAESSRTGLRASLAQPQIVKSSSTANYDAVGDTVSYTFQVTNNTAVTLTGVTVADALTDAAAGSTAPSVTCQTRSNPAGTCSGASTTLAPNQVATFVATYTVKAADIDFGHITDQATATAQPPTGGALSSLSNSVTVPAVQTPALTLQKSASPTTVNAVGQSVTWSFKVTNTGNTTVSSVGVNEQSFSGTGLTAIQCPSTTLAAGASTTCTATSAVSQADLDAGTITNTATATGVAPGGQAVASTASTASVTATQNAKLTISKTASPSTVTAAGQQVTFRFLVTNTGNTTLTNVQPVEQSFTGTNALGAIQCPSTTLVPGTNMTCTAAYTVSQLDVDHGVFANTANATATAPGNLAVASTSSTAPVTATQSPALTLTKTSTPTFVTTAGQTVTYQFVVRNSGNVTMTGIDVAEQSFTGSGTVSAITCPVTTLAPTVSTTCTASYTVDQADIDRGTIENTAAVTGVDPTGTTSAPVSSSAIVTVAQVPGLTIVKSATPTQVAAPGQVVQYSFEVGNDGNVTINNVTVHEVSFTGTGTTAGAGRLDQPTCPQTSVAPNATMTCTASYTVTQADIDAGTIVNTANATGTDPGGAATTSPTSSVTVTVAQAPALTLTKTADRSTVTADGQTIHYTLHVENSGNVGIAGIVAADQTFTGSGAPGAIQCPQTGLAPLASMDCTASYTVTQQDIDRGSVVNTAVASGSAANGSLVTSNASTATVTATQTAGLTVVKSVDRPTVDAAGQSITYSFHVTNSGNVTVTGIAAHELAFTGAGTLSAVTCPVSSLAPGVDTTCVATYQVTQADIDAGQITNTGDATGTDPNGAAVTATASQVTVTVDQAPELTLTKTADAVTVNAPGQLVTFRFHIVNSGNVTVTGVDVVEGAFTGTGTLAPVGCSGTLAPGQAIDCSVTYTSTQADVDRGQIENTATATGTDPNNAAVTSADSTATVAVDRHPALTLVKQADRSSVTAAGQRIGYTFHVTNVGNTTLQNVAINERTFTGTGSLSVTCPVAPLAPGADITCTAAYSVTTTDLRATSITNTAVAMGAVPLTLGVLATSDPSTAKVTVDAARAAGLASTGVNTATALLGAILLVIAGGALALIRQVRRRRSS